MNRHYDTAFYRDLVGRIRAKFENASITTDIMVGFAGESEEEFNESLDFYKEIGFARGHVFAYSKRAGTVAAALKNQVDEAVKTHRARLMGDAAKASEEAFVKTQIGTKAKVLFEKDNPNDREAQVMALSRQALLSTAELIKCVEVGATDISTDCKLLNALYADTDTTCDNIRYMMQDVPSQAPVTMAVANLYLRKQIIFERV